MAMIDVDDLNRLLNTTESLGREPSELTHDLGMWMRQHGFEVLRLLKASAARDAWLGAGDRELSHELDAEGRHGVCFADETEGPLINGNRSTTITLPAQSGWEKSYLEALEGALEQVGVRPMLEESSR